MGWRAISEADLLTKISGDELEALREAALGEGQDDPVASAIAQVSDMARGYIAANANNVLGAAGTVPERIVGALVDILVVDIGSRVAGTIIDPNDVRSTAKRNAVDMLRDIAAGRFAIEPAGSATESSGPAVRIISKDTRRPSRSDMAGL